jgi:photosystem II stability/assembly factor-like uncharacterized protein
VQQTLPGDIDVALGIDFINQNHGLLGGWHTTVMPDIAGNAYYTTNGGTNWIEATYPDSLRGIVSIQMMDENIAYGAGAYNITTVKNLAGNFYKYATHNSQMSEYCAKLGMDFSYQQDYRGYFIETTDGGISWHPKGSFEDSVYYLIDLHFIDLQTGFVLATGPANNTFAAILKTTDCGNNWNYVYNFETFLFLNEIKFFDQLNGIAVGTFDDATNSYGVVLITTDGGENWIRTALPQLFFLSSVTYLNINSILISGIKNDASAVIFRSDDGGNTWFECCTYTNLHLINGINSFPSSGVIVVYGQYQPTGSAIPFVEATIDNGMTWHYNLLSQFQDYSFTKSKLVDENRWYITGTQFAQMGFILFTDDSGGIPVELISFTADVNNNKVRLQWQTATELNNLGFEIERKSDKNEWRMIGFKEGKGTTTEIQNYLFIDDLFGIDSEQLYYRLKQIDLDGKFEYSEVVEIEVPILNNFKLSQNYPNPFNPLTKIEYQIPQLSFVTLKIYDVLGNEITTLVNEEKPAGSYEVEFDANKLPSGIYFYQLKTGSYVQSRKMVFLK